MTALPLWGPNKNRRAIVALGAGQLYRSCALNIVVAEVTSVARSARFDGTISVLPVLARLANAATYCSATLRFTAFIPPGSPIASATWRIRFGLASAIDRIAAA